MALNQHFRPIPGFGSSAFHTISAIGIGFLAAVSSPAYSAWLEIEEILEQRIQGQNAYQKAWLDQFSGL
jgi:hypothetical protein